MSETQTLGHARLVNAVVSAAALCIGSNDPKSVVLDAGGTRYARIAVVLEDVAAALNADREVVRLALESALAQGMMVAPEGGGAVRPATL